MDLDGAIDLHVHTAPDIYGRSVDDQEAVDDAARAGMRAILLKSHHTLTADRAALAGKGQGVRVFGGLALNWPCGGLNPVAVETALAFGAKQIWLPTLHAAHCLSVAEQAVFRAEVEKGRRGIAVIAPDGTPAPGLLPIMEQVRDADAILGTGHVAPREGLAVLRQAKDMGLRKALVTHPHMSFTRYTLAEMAAAAALGGVLEFDYLSCMPSWIGAVPVEETARAIAAVGPRHCVIATDGGQEENPRPAAMLAAFADELAAAGATPEALRLMMRENPAWLLGV